MKLFDFRLVLTVLFTVLCGYLLWPTFQDYQNTKKVAAVVSQKKNAIKSQNKEISQDQLEKLAISIEDSLKMADPSIRDARMKRIKLGLDLQGGMRIVLEVNTAKLIEKIAQNQDDDFKAIMKEAAAQAAISDEPIVNIVVAKLKAKGIRLSRYFGTIRQEDDQIVSDLTKAADDAVSRAIEIIRNRIDQYGVSEPSIQKQGDRRILVELPGIAKEEEARQLIQGTALLEFKLLKEPEFTFNVMQRIDEVLAGKVIEDSTASDSTKADSALAAKEKAAKKDSANKQLTPEEFAKEHPFFSIALLDPQGRSAEAYVKASNKDKLMRILSRPDVQSVIPNNGEFLFGAKPATFQDGEGIYLLYFVNRNPELTGGVITNAQAQIDQNTSAAIVTMEMNADGATEWSRITGANIDKRCAIILDGVVFSAPVIRGKIPGGRSQIEGMENLDEAKLLEIVLKAGALPAPVDIIEERSVGPSLGQDSVSNGLNSMMIGYVIIAFFMMLYYRSAGNIAAAGLTLTVLFILGVLAGFKATLTLPGIAGIVLTMGMAVDANVLIYERIREELATGKTIRAAVDIGFAKANSAIIDSNLTTLITCIILYQFGSGPVQGFALTLMIGILTSLFAALIFARLIFDFMVYKGYKINLG